MSVIPAAKGDAAQRARSLYRQLLRQGGQFTVYSFREYARRRTKDSFREHKDVHDPREIQELMQKGLKELQVMKRQTVISQFFQLDRLVVEGGKSGKQGGRRNDIVRQKDTGWHLAPSGSNRRQNRTGYVDHDVFEGLPIRHWRRDYVTVAPSSSQENTNSQNDIWAVELPHGMPKDSHMLPQHSQDLLRAARSGRIYKRPAPVEEEDPDGEIILGDKPEKKDDDIGETGFAARAWKQIPRHLEGPDIEYLAKRRKGLITLPPSGTAPTTTLTKTTVKRIDAAGNSYMQDVVIAPGQQVEGEIIAQTAIPDPAAAPVGDAVSIQATPPRRKPAAVKKKLKGPGRGRKKKQVAPTSMPVAVPVEGSKQNATEIVDPDGIKIESDTTTGEPKNTDTKLVDGSMVASDNDEDSEGEDDEESMEAPSSPLKDQQPSPLPKTAPVLPEIFHLDPPDVQMSGTEPDILPTIGALSSIKDEGKSGSPLKNIAMTNSTLASPLEAPPDAPFPALATVEENEQGPPLTIENAEAEIQQTAVDTPLPPPPPEPTVEHQIAAVLERQEEEREEVVLLDIIENTNNSKIGTIEPGIDQVPEPPLIKKIPIQESEPVLEQSVAKIAPKPGSVEEEEDDFPDLLGGLERSLNKAEQSVSAPPALFDVEQEVVSDAPPNPAPLPGFVTRPEAEVESTSISSISTAEIPVEEEEKQEEAEGQADENVEDKAEGA
ncbi:hypothetical protein B7494_g5513 [Chlorociboria aeruginascens]|nr:hypothetical protein B7494_g5513 [Chlorociboria aeruginascens]